MTPHRHAARRPVWPGWTALCLWTALIFYLAGAPASMFPRMPPILPWDKFVHAGEWALWSGILLGTLRRQAPDYPLHRLFLWTVLPAAVGAFLQEMYQIPIPGRSCDPLDWVADMIGSIVVALVLVHLAPRLRQPGKR